MTNETKPGQFSPVSLEALELIAKREKKDPRLLLAYLGLARHTTMNDLDGRGPNMLTGAGAEKVRVLTGCGTPMATGIVSALAGMGLIKKPAQGLPLMQARWAMQHQGTVKVPHALIDGGIGSADSIGRLLKQGATEEVVVCAIMLLVHCYAVHDLEMFGGVNRQHIRREWRHLNKPEENGYRVAAEAKSLRASTVFMTRILGSMDCGLDEDGNSRLFWKAFELVRDTGLFYEVVTSICVEGTRTPIRVNDFHAIASDASLLDAAAARGVGFYVHKNNDRSEPEGCWFYLPSEPENVTGIWRLRFRCATPETARGIELDRMRVDRAITEMCEKGILYSA